MPRPVPPYIATFDSASAMVRALGHFLRGKAFPRLGTRHTAWAHVAAPLVNALPRRLAEQVYIWSGWSEAIPPERLGEVDAEAISRWVVSEYPRRRYPAVMVGSSNGAMVHLCAALGIPWLPQTFLIPVRRSGVHPDDPVADMQWARGPARLLLDANPELQLHHMHDPAQDRLMIQQMTYFRVKRLRLGRTYRQFIEELLEPGGTIFVCDCATTWPTVQIGERHVFQPGAVGGASPDEYLHGSPRVAEYLERYGSPRRSWSSPEPDAQRPEAEWGFEESLGRDVMRLAARRGYDVRRIRFDDPEDMSPLVADLYGWWYRQRRIPASRLLAESFIVMEPYWALRTGAVPFWMVFNTESSAEALDAYLDAREPFDELLLMLFSHGVDSVGLATIERWRAILSRARRRGAFIGVDEDAYPRDFATFVRYHPALKRKVAARYPLPGALALRQLDEFLAEADGRYPVKWLDHESVPISSEAP